ncbi:MAG: polyprenyl synthetase family protein [Acidobacteriia bacterium]|nr:polyprenyl synthetase family protein [Terriglobia bacterium]
MSTSDRFPSRAERLLQEPVAAAPAIFSLVEERLQAVEATFRRNLASPVGIIDEIGGFVADGGGKRVRPAIHLLCAKLCGYGGSHDVLMATVLELIHSATLIHDDIIDEAKTRRGRPSVNHRWGNNVTVLFGDYMLAKAMEMALDAESLRIIRKLAEITLRMTEGEMLQTRYVGRLDLTVAEYSDLIERKTAVLFAGCCEIAGMLAGVDAATEGALGRFGTRVGLAFQMVDDLLDFTGDPRTLGKPAGSDLCEGKATLALIYLLASGDGRGLDLARRIMDGGGAGAPEIAELTDLLEESGALSRARAQASRTATEAVAELEHFPDGPARRALAAVPGYLISRDR